MLLIPIMMVALAGEPETASQQPGDVFHGLSGACWRASFGKGTTDTHCFSVAPGGQLVMDVHKVRNAAGEVTYEGVTLYRAGTAGVDYDYYNSLGDLYPGRGHRDGDAITFTDRDTGEVQTAWSLTADGYTTRNGHTENVFQRAPDEAPNGL